MSLLGSFRMASFDILKILSICSPNSSQKLLNWPSSTKVLVMSPKMMIIRGIMAPWIQEDRTPPITSIRSNGVANRNWKRATASTLSHTLSSSSTHQASTLTHTLSSSSTHQANTLLSVTLTPSRSSNT